MKKLMLIVGMFSLMSSCAWFSKDHKFIDQVQGTWVNVMDADTLFEEWNYLSDKKLYIKNYSLINFKDTTIWMEGIASLSDSGFSFLTNENITYKGKGAGDQFIFSTQQVTYPQQVNYLFIGVDSLRIRYEGTVDGEPFQEDLYFKKLKITN